MYQYFFKKGCLGGGAQCCKGRTKNPPPCPPLHDKTGPISYFIIFHSSNSFQHKEYISLPLPHVIKGLRKKIKKFIFLNSSRFSFDIFQILHRGFSFTIFKFTLCPTRSLKTKFKNKKSFKKVEFLTTLILQIS